MRISVKRSDQPGDIRERFTDYRTSGFCQCAHAERFTRLEERKDVKRIKNFTLSQDEVRDLKALGVCNFKLANRQVPSQQYAKWMDYYMIDRLGLSTTMCRARVLSTEVRA